VALLAAIVLFFLKPALFAGLPAIGHLASVSGAHTAGVGGPNDGGVSGGGTAGVASGHTAGVSGGAHTAGLGPTNPETTGWSGVVGDGGASTWTGVAGQGGWSGVVGPGHAPPVPPGHDAYPPVFGLGVVQERERNNAEMRQRPQNPYHPRSMAQHSQSQSLIPRGELSGQNMSAARRYTEMEGSGTGSAGSPGPSEMSEETSGRGELAGHSY